MGRQPCVVSQGTLWGVKKIHTVAMVWNIRVLVRIFLYFQAIAIQFEAIQMAHIAMWKISFFPAGPHYHLLSVISRNTVAAISKSLSDILPERGIQAALVAPFFCFPQRNQTSSHTV